MERLEMSKRRGMIGEDCLDRLASHLECKAHQLPFVPHRRSHLSARVQGPRLSFGQLGALVVVLVLGTGTLEDVLLAGGRLLHRRRQEDPPLDGRTGIKGQQRRLGATGR